MILNVNQSNKPQLKLNSYLLFLEHIRIVFLILLIFSVDLNSIYSQNIWNRLSNQITFQPEDIALTNSGKIYVSLLGKNYIMESSDFGIHWRNIVNDTFKYNTFNSQKELFIDNQDSLIELFDQYGLVFPRYYLNNKFILDTLSFSKNASIGDGNIKYDHNNNYYYVYSNELHKYQRLWFDSQIIFNKGDRISDYFVYSDTTNYVITNKPNGTFDIYKLNTFNGNYRLLVHSFLPSGSKNILITESGRILIPTFQGLLYSRNDGMNSEYLVFDSLVNPKVKINDLRFSLSGDIFMQAGNTYYFSNNEGETWVKLLAFNNEFPDFLKIKKLLILDSLHAVSIINDICDLEHSYFLTPLEAKWKTLDLGISILNLSDLVLTNTNRLYANNQQCEIVYSDDESKTWDSYYIQGSNLVNITSTKPNILFAITKDKRKLYNSLNGGKDWTLINDSQLSIANLEILGINPLFDQTLIIEGGIRDSGSVSYKEMYFLVSRDNGQNWEVLPKSSNMFIYNLIWDGNNRIYSYFVSLNTVYYSIDFGKTWNIDSNFNGFDNIYSIYFGKDNKVLIYGRYQGEFNIYISHDRKNFVPCIGNDFKNQNVIFSQVDSLNVLAIAGLSGVYISNDGGINWNNITSGISIFDSTITTINSICYDKDNNAYLSINNDGLYKSIKPLITSEHNTVSEHLSQIYPNPFRDDIFIINNDYFQNRYLVEIYNPLGILVKKEFLNNDFNQIHFELDFHSGIYFIKLTKNNKTIQINKLIRTNF